MARYKFIGSVETVLVGLRNGIEAVLHRAGGHGQPVGSTVVVQPGDEVDMKAPYPHAWLQPVTSDEDEKKKTAAAKRAAKAAEKKAVQAASSVPTPVAAPVALPEGESR